MESFAHQLQTTKIIILINIDDINHILPSTKFSNKFQCCFRLIRVEFGILHIKSLEDISFSHTTSYISCEEQPLDSILQIFIHRLTKESHIIWSYPISHRSNPEVKICQCTACRFITHSTILCHLIIILSFESCFQFVYHIVSRF